MEKWTRIGRYVVLVVLLALCGRGPALAAEVTVRAEVDTTEVYVGEAFTLRLTVDGDEDPKAPDMSVLAPDFSAVDAGGGRNSSSSMTIINGKVVKESHAGYVFRYELRAKRAGELTIPALAVKTSAGIRKTVPIVIRVKAPEKRDDFSLELIPAKTGPYVGEAVELKVVWSIGHDEVKEYSFSLPFLDDPRLAVTPLDADGPRDELLEIALGGGRSVVARKGTTMKNGRRMLTVTMRFLLRPRKAGKIDLAPGSVSCRYLAGLRAPARRDPFSDFFNDDFFNMNMLGRSRRVYRTAAVPSNALRLQVKPLPEQGRPPGFSGLVGDFSLAASADPVTAKVGDPITLTIQVAGEHVEAAEAPDLAAQLGADFKVPADMAPGVTDDSGMVKTFTQTIRAKNASVRRIPALTLDFFDPETGRYRTARSEPIDLTIKPARVVTAADAVGAAPAAPAAAGSDHHAVTGGPLPVFTGPRVLEHRPPPGRIPHRRLWALACGVPPLLFCLLAVFLALRGRRRQNEAARAARTAYRHLRKSLAPGGDPETVLAALREYLGARLGLNPASLTMAEAEPRLQEAGVDEGARTALSAVFADCEAACYGGARDADLAERAVAAAGEVEENLKKGGAS